MDLGFLERLTLQLTLGASQFPEELLNRHVNYLSASQRSDGGWSGREGGSDLYYTGFALRSLAFLGFLEGDVAEKAAGFLRNQLQFHQPWIDLFSLLFGARLIDAACGIDCLKDAAEGWEERMEQQLSELRRADGGYSKSEEGRAGSTYQTFLVVVLFELLGREIPNREELVQFLRSQYQDDGGYLEIRVAKRSGTNPTAAAIAALGALDARKDVNIDLTAAFLADLQTDEGGFQANTRLPIPDVLSTFTALTTLWDLERLEEVDLAAAVRYVLSMQRQEGGFAGFELDPSQDVEYTFYGLGTLALASASGCMVE